MALNIHDYRAEISAINTVIGADGKHTIVVEVAGGLNTGGSTVDVSGLATSALQGDTNTALTAINTKLAGTLVVNGSGFTQPVSVSILPLPTGAATSAKQDTGNVSLASIDTKLSGTLTVNGSGVTQPVSAVSLPLPTGAATEATLNALKNAVLAQIEIASTLWTDDSGTFYVRRDTVNEQTGVVTVGWFTPQGNTATPGTGLRPASGVKDYEISSTPYVATAAGTGYSIGDSLIHALVLEVSGAAPTVAASVWLNITTGLVVSPAPAGANIAYQSALPTGAATAALQTTGNTSLASIDTKLGGTLTVNGSGVTQPVSAAALPLPTGAATAALQTTGNTSLSSAVSALGATTDAASGTDATGSMTHTGLLKRLVLSITSLLTKSDTGNTSLASIDTKLGGTLTVNGSGVTQPVSAAALPLPTGAATAALQTTGNTSLASIDTKLGGTLTVNGSGVTQPVSATALPLPTGAATAALQTTGNTSLASAVSALGATADAASGTDATGSMTHTGLLKRLVLSLTSLLTKSDTGNTSLASIDTKLGGTLTVNGSGATQPVSAAALPLPTGASTAALQTTGNASLSSIDTKLGSQATATLQTSANDLLGQIKTAIETNGTGGGGGASVPTGTAGTPNASVVTVQGILGGTLLKSGPGGGRAYGVRPLFYDANPVVADAGQFIGQEMFMGGGIIWTSETGNTVRVVNGVLAIRGNQTANILVMWTSRYNSNSVLNGDAPIVRGSPVSDVKMQLMSDLNTAMVLEPTAQVGGYTLYQFDTPFNWFTWDVVASQGRGGLFISAYDGQMNFTADEATNSSLFFTLNFETLAAPSI